ncbi:MAG: TonB-dependent receptor [Sulfuricella sp.]|nr:TonB-dependent receptor [Sulfuricella sp.]
MKPYRIRAIALSCAVLGAFAPKAYALDDSDELALVYGDKDTIRLATGSPQSLRRAPAVASVITAEDIRAMGATDLDEVLASVPGIHVSHSANNYAPLFVVRGIYSQSNPQTLVLQNGIPLTALQQGNRGSFWGGYPVENIARIEVIRGPGSALYGADAYAGVINIITKAAADISGSEAGVRIGSFNTRDIWAQHGGMAGPVAVAASVRAGSSDGFKEIIAADAQTRNDKAFPTGTPVSRAPGPVNLGKDILDADLNLGYEKWRLQLGYKLRDHMGTAAGVNALDPAGQIRSERITADLSWSDPEFSQHWATGWTASYANYAQDVDQPYQLLPPGARTATGVFVNGMLSTLATSESHLRLSAFATYSGFAGHSLRLGLGHDDLDMYQVSELRNFTYNANGAPVAAGPLIPYYGDSAFLSPHRRQVSYAYVQDEWRMATDWTLTAGLRHDHFSDAGGTTNPRVALVWDAAYDVVAKLLYGEAFRAPSFAELYSINNPVNRGNPDLRPETIRTLEAAISWQARKDLQLNLNIFKYAMKDLIRAVPNTSPAPGVPPAPGNTVTNIGQQEGDGFEMEMIWDVSHALRLTGSYSHQASIDTSTNQDAGYAPHHMVYLRGDWQFASGPLLSTQFNWVADRRRAAGDLRPNIADYKTVDVTLRSGRGKGRWEFAGSVRNLFNADIREPSLAPGLTIPDDLPMAPRAVYLQAIYRL